MKLAAPDLLAAGVADAIVPEPEGGAHEDYAQAGAALRAALLGMLAELDERFGQGVALDVPALLADRLAKYRRIGVVQEAQPQ
jgi:acetyl-CoA carboxylase carboxyl transferase subunit alpha